MAPSDLRRKVIFFCCTNKQGARREGPLTSLLGNGFSFFKGLNFQLNVNTPHVSEYLVDAVIALKVVPGDCVFCLCLARLVRWSCCGWVCAGLPEISAAARHPAPLAKRTCHRLKLQLRLSSTCLLDPASHHGFSCTAADATPPSETWRFGTGFIADGQVSGYKVILDVGKSVATYSEWVFGPPCCS